MQIREAILKAADTFKRDPSLFKFHEIMVPPCGSPGCAIGLIAAFQGIPEGKYVFDACQAALGVSEAVFYERMRLNNWPTASHRVTWTSCGIEASRRLRLYADKYHPATKPEGIPDSVRNIFTMTAEQLKREIEAA